MDSFSSDEAYFEMEGFRCRDLGMEEGKAPSGIKALTKAITVAPIPFAIWIAVSPNPPAAASTTITSPLFNFALSTKAT